MAVITDEDVQGLWRGLYRKGQGKEEIKADGLVDPATIKAIFQATEDWFEGDQPALRGLITAAKGGPITDAAADKYVRAWQLWKWGQG